MATKDAWLASFNLGHSSPKTTAIYTHLTRAADELAAEAINRVMSDLQ